MQKKRVLVTRSFKENQKLCQQINKECFDVVSWDLIKYSHTAIQKRIITEVLLSKKITDVIITGKYCASLIPKINKSNKFWVVGNAASQILQKQGANVFFIAKNVDELIDRLPEAKDGFVYLSGNYITKDMPLEIKRFIVYKVKYKSTLSNKEVSQALEGLDYILLFSLNCGCTLAELLLKYNLLEPLKGTKIIAISAKVSNFIRLYFKNTIYCVNENIDQMLEILENDE